MGVEVINARNWELLMNAVDEKRVVPIIGDNLVTILLDDGTRVPVREYLLRELSLRFGGDGTCRAYSEIEDLIREYNRKLRNPGDMTDIYFEIFDILGKAKVSLPEFAVRFFGMCRFPLVLTTSCVRGIDKLLGVQPENVRIYGKKAASDLKQSELDSGQTMLYYLFGRAGMTRRSFKVTEDDLLDYLHCWHNCDTRPAYLGEYLSDKFLLVLGCDYPNWLFRFFWHSIRNFTIVPPSADMQGVVTVSPQTIDADADLMNFLSRVQTSVYSKAEDFMNEFMCRYQDRASFGRTSEEHMADEQQCDIFISYASEDYETARQVAGKFRDYGALVWFDKADLDAGEKYQRTIVEKIRECKRFVPILSKSTLVSGRRFFKKEWLWAIDEAGYRLNEPFISPVVVDGMDPFSEKSIPAEFREDAHVINFSDEDFDRQVKTIIRSFR